MRVYSMVKFYEADDLRCRTIQSLDRCYRGGRCLMVKKHALCTCIEMSLTGLINQLYSTYNNVTRFIPLHHCLLYIVRFWSLRCTCPYSFLLQSPFYQSLSIQPSKLNTANQINNSLRIVVDDFNLLQKSRFYFNFIISRI